MTEPKLPIDARLGTHRNFRATALLKDGEHHDGAREYLVRWRDGTVEGDGVPVVQCQTPLQLTAVYRSLCLGTSKVEEQTLAMCTDLVGCVMSKRIHGDDFYDSGREHMGYELAWLPGGTYGRIVHALERAGEHGLAALMREGRVDKP